MRNLEHLPIPTRLVPAEVKTSCKWSDKHGKCNEEASFAIPTMSRDMTCRFVCFCWKHIDLAEILLEDARRN